METVLKEGYEKILKLFYLNKNKEIHLRDIARKTKLNENSVSRFLKRLEEEKLLISKKDGNLKKYKLLKNKKAFLVLSLFDIERLEKLPKLRKDAIDYFLNNLKDKPLIALLFGSTAKRTFNDKSDLDVLLIVNKKIKTETSENYTEAQTNIKVNIIQINLLDFVKELKMKQDLVIQSALNSGYPLTNHIYFYEVVMNEN